MSMNNFFGFSGGGGSGGGGSGFVPYVNANQPVDLNTQNFSTQGLVNIGNASSSNQLQLRIGQGTSFMDIGSYTSDASTAAVYMNKSVPDSVNYLFAVTAGGDTYMSSLGVLGLLINGAFKINIDPINSTFSNYQNVFQPLAVGGGNSTGFTVITANNTSQGSGVDTPGILFNSGSRQWMNGTITLQEEFKITAPSYSHVSGSNTITTAGTLNVYAPTTSGGFTTITNNFAIISNGNIKVTGSRINFPSLPTSSSGLSTGDLWNNLGIINIV